MSGRIARSVRQIKLDLGSIVNPDLILKLCTAAGHLWRDRALGPVQTIFLFITQILHGNTSCAHVRQLGNFAFTRSAYCEARNRVPVGMLRALLRETGQRLTQYASRMGRRNEGSGLRFGVLTLSALPSSGRAVPGWAGPAGGP